MHSHLQLCHFVPLTPYSHSHWEMGAASSVDGGDVIDCLQSEASKPLDLSDLPDDALRDEVIKMKFFIILVFKLCFSFLMLALPMPLAERRVNVYLQCFLYDVRSWSTTTHPYTQTQKVRRLRELATRLLASAPASARADFINQSSDQYHKDCEDGLAQSLARVLSLNVHVSGCDQGGTTGVNDLKGASTVPVIATTIDNFESSHAKRARLANATPLSLAELHELAGAQMRAVIASDELSAANDNEHRGEGYSDQVQLLVCYFKIWI